MDGMTSPSRSTARKPAVIAVRAAALLGLCLSGQASAQPDDPALHDPSIAEQEADLASRRANPPTIMPSSEPTVRTPLPGQPGAGELLPGLVADELGVPLGRLYAEGSFLVRRAGAMLQAPSGEWIFVFNPSLDGQIDTPVVLVPSAELEHVLPTISQDQTPRPLVLTGQVLVYAGRNYVIPLSIIDGEFSTANPAPAAASGDVASAAEQPASEAPVRDLAADPDVAELIADLEERRETPRGLAPRTPGGLGAGRESLLTPTAIQTLPEGTMLVRRRTRMVRESSGAWSLALDNDSGQDASRLIILPCQNLAAMERLATGAGEEAEFEVTARVLSFQGRNYAMPLMFWLMRAGEMRALQ